MDKEKQNQDLKTDVLGNIWKISALCMWKNAGNFNFTTTAADPLNNKKGGKHD